MYVCILKDMSKSRKTIMRRILEDIFSDISIQIPCNNTNFQYFSLLLNESSIQGQI